MALPSNVHVSQHPSLLAKLSQLRSKSASSRDVKSLIHEISLIIACEAVSSALKPVNGPKVAPPPCPSPIETYPLLTM